MHDWGRGPAYLRVRYMSCPACVDPLTVYYPTRPLTTNVVRHSALYRCPSCGALYEVFPEEKVIPREITEAEAQALFSTVG